MLWEKIHFNLKGLLLLDKVLDTSWIDDRKKYLHWHQTPLKKGETTVSWDCHLMAYIGDLFTCLGMICFPTAENICNSRLNYWVLNVFWAQSTKNPTTAFFCRIPVSKRMCCRYSYQTSLLWSLTPSAPLFNGLFFPYIFFFCYLYGICQFYYV